MDVQEFTSLLDSYGANSSRWPADQREAATVFVTANTGVSKPLLQSAQALDSALDHARAVTASDLLQRRILAKAPNPFLSDWRHAAAAAAAVLVIGTMGGYAGGTLVSQSNADTTEDYYADAFGSLSTDWEIDLGGGV